MTEVRTTSTTGGQKGVKPEAFNLIPHTPQVVIGRAFSLRPVPVHQVRTMAELHAHYQFSINMFWEQEGAGAATMYHLGNAGAALMDMYQIFHTVDREFIDNRPDELGNLPFVSSSDAQSLPVDGMAAYAALDEAKDYRGLSLLPTDALEALARHYNVGAQKYSANNWRRGYEISKNYAAGQRHMAAWWGGENLDEETGSSHLSSALWHVFSMIFFLSEQGYEVFDDRPRMAPDA